MTDLVRQGTVERKHYRGEIPEEHRASMDTRIRWLWNQRWGTVQKVYYESPDMLDRTAAITFIQAIMSKDLSSIELIFTRLEGGAMMDEEVLERAGLRV